MVIQQVDFLVIGGGPGGAPTAMALASAGKSVMLVEKGQGLGGTCLFEGCIPSKILRETARRLRELKQAQQFGLCLPMQDVSVNWSVVMRRKHSILAQRSQGALHKSEQFTNLKTVFGVCRLRDAHSVEIKTQAGETLEVNFKIAILATGSLPYMPPIKGSDHLRVYTSESILNIDHIPERLVIIGGGPIGVELGQVFNTLGSEVSILEAASRILGSVDEELAARLQQRMLDDGIDIQTNCKVNGILTTGQNVFVQYIGEDGTEQRKLAGTVLMVTGRRPNVEGLGLENTNVKYDTHGITVSDTLQTSEAGIYAVGDLIGQPMFAHWATAQGLALAHYLTEQSVMFPAKEINSAVIFSEPEIGIAGLTEQQAKQAGLNTQVIRYDYKQDARAQITGSAEGLMKIVFDVDSRRVIGVHILVKGAGELIGEAALLVKTGIPIEEIASAIHPHPTLSESFVMVVRNMLAQAAKPLAK